MELKDVVLSALAEIENDNQQDAQQSSQNSPAIRNEPAQQEAKSSVDDSSETLTPLFNERFFLEAVKERLLVLFEGFQSPNNVAIEAKVELTLNFLEYLLATVESRLAEIKDRRKDESI